MENVSRALLMAAEVLIGVLILSLMVYLFVTFGSSSAKIGEQIDENRLAEFNSQYNKYVGKDDVTIYDIVSVANLAKENNKYYGLDTSTGGNYYISVKIGNTPIEKYSLEYLTETYIKNESGELKKYSCNVEYSNVTGRVKKVVFRES